MHPLCQDFVGLLVALPWICFHIFLTTLCRLRLKRAGDTRQRIEPSSPRCPMGTRSGELPLACERSPARAAPHKRSGTCAVRFRTCLYQTSAQLTARGRGAKFSMKSTEKLLHPAPGEHARRDDPQANPLDFRIKLIIMNCIITLARRFLDGVVHTSLSTPAPKWSSAAMATDGLDSLV